MRPIATTLKLILLGAFTLLALCACDGRSGSSGVLPADDSGAGEITTLKTKVALSFNAARAPLGGAVPLAATDAEYRAASVTLTLPDGRVLAMTYDGAGEYSCRIENLSGGATGYIEAEFGGVVVKNFFDGLVAQGGQLDAGLTDPDSTLAADALAAFAQALAPVEGGYSVAQLLSGIGGATLDIDVTALRAQVEGGQVAGYELARSAYRAALTWDNVNLTTGQVANLISGDANVTTLRQRIAAGGLTPPLRTDDAQTAKSVVSDFIDAYLNGRTAGAISPYLADADFLHAGDDKTQFLLNAEGEWANSPKFVNLQSADLSGLTFSARPVADFTGAASAMFLVSVDGTYDLTYAGPQTVTRAWDGSATGLYVGRTGPQWAIYGDRMRLGFDYSVGYFNTSTMGTFTVLDFALGNSNTWWPSLVTASNPALFGANDPVTLDPVSVDMVEYRFSLEGSQDTNWAFYGENGFLQTALPYLDIDSEVVTVTATFPDAGGDIVETYEKVVRIREPTTVITGFTQNPNGSISLSWRPPLVDAQLLRVEVRLVGRGLHLTLPSSERSATLSASSLALAGLVEGEQAAIDVIYFTAASEIAARQNFTYAGTSSQDRVAAPVLDPPPGQFFAPQSVTITCATAGSQIFYTTDGASPTLAGLPYTGPINVDRTMTVKAVATAPSMANSPITAGSYGINAPPALTVVTRSLAEGLLGVPYSRNVVAAGGEPPYVFDLAAGALPDGLGLDPSGAITGTPTATGLYSFTVRATDAPLATATQNLTIEVTGPPAITTTSLPDGLTGVPYSQTLAATGGVAPYSWQATAGLPTGLTLDPSTGTISGAPTVAGAFTFTVRATGANTLYDQLPFSIAVTGPPAVATASLPGGLEGVSYLHTLAATGGVGPYVWSVASGSLPDGLGLSVGGVLAGTPTALGVFNFTVRATGGNTLYGERALSIEVTGAPTITTASVPGGVVGQAYATSFTATGGVPPFNWGVLSGSLPDGLAFNNANASINGAPTTVGSSTFTVRLTGGNGLFHERTYTIDVSAAPQPPAITSVTLPGGLVGVSYSYSFGATGGTTPYAWSVAGGTEPAGLALSAGGVLSGIPTAPGSYNFTVRVTGGNALFSEAPFNVTVTGPPKITTSALPSGAEGLSYSAQLTANGGVAPLAWTWVGGFLPAGLTLAGDGSIAGIPTAAGSYNFTVRATGQNGLFDEANLAIAIAGPPTITTASLTGLTAGAPYSGSLAATGGLPPYAWSLFDSLMPDGLTLNPDGTVTGTPTTAGPDSFIVECIDANGLSATQTVDVNVAAAPAAPTITTVSLPDGVYTLPYSQTIAASGGSAPYTFAVVAGSIISGVTLNPSTGELSGAPDFPSTYNFTVRVTGANALFSEQAYSVAVTGPPVILTTALPDAMLSTAYPYGVSAAQGVAPYVWSMESGSLPPGLTLGADGLFSGSPSNSGAFNFTVRVTGGNTLFATKNLTINVIAPLNILTTALPDGQMGSAYSQPIAATGGYAPYGWSIVAGALPTGVTITTTGELSGTPAVSGVFNFTVRAQNFGGGAFDDQPLTLNVAPPATPKITTASPLPEGVVGDFYNLQLAAVGGQAPYTWQMATGTLPPGVALTSDGMLDGVPGAEGAFVFTARVTDQLSQTDQATFTLNVYGQPVITTSVLPTATQGSAYSFFVQATGGKPPYVWSILPSAQDEFGTTLVSNFPPGMAIDPATGELNGAPAVAGVYTFWVACFGDNGVGQAWWATLSVIGN